MREREFDRPQYNPSRETITAPTAARELWSLDGAFFTLRGLAIATTFGDALAP